MTEYNEYENWIVWNNVCLPSCYDSNSKIVSTVEKSVLFTLDNLKYYIHSSCLIWDILALNFIALIISSHSKEKKCGRSMYWDLLDLILMNSEWIIKNNGEIKSLSMLGFEPRFLRPQRRVLTTRRHRHVHSPINWAPFVESRFLNT